MRVYVIASDAGAVKVGMSGNPLARLAALQGANGHRLRLVTSYDLGDKKRARMAERGAHRRLWHRHLTGEWFGVDVAEASEAVRQSVAMVDDNPDPTPVTMIDPAQMRAARGLLNWTMQDLSERCGVSLASIKNIERAATDPRVSTLQAIQSAFEAAGIVFVDEGDTRPAGKGVRFSRKPSPPSSDC